MLGGVKLKKTNTAVKSMFKAGEGATTAKATAPSGDGRKALSKLVDFPGDLKEVTKHLADPTINPAGADARGPAPRRNETNRTEDGAKVTRSKVDQSAADRGLTRGSPAGTASRPS